MLRIEKVNKFYQSGTEKIHALKDITLTLPDKGLVFILGPSGCGKSTLLNLLGGLDQPSSGKILIEDRDLTSFTKYELNQYLNSYLGFVFQEYNILKDLNLFENISLPLEMQNYSRRYIKKKVTSTLKQVGLDNLEKRKVNQLSGGQRQRIAIARALIKEPKMIIADEPTGNLDSETGATIFELFKKLAEERLIIIVTHDEESAFHYGDRIIQIDDGMIVEDTAPLLIFNQTNKLELKKAKVPFLTSVKLSLKNIYKKKFRFSIMTIICALSLAFLSFTIELKGDKLRQNIYTTVDNGYHYIEILARTKSQDNFISGNFYDQYRGIHLGVNSYNDLKQLNPGLNIHQYQKVGIDIAGDNYKIARTYYPGTIDTIVKYDDHNRYELLVGYLPTTPSEILVTDYLIDQLQYFNVLESDFNYYNYLGKQLKLNYGNNYKIVGIIKTKHQTWRHFFREGLYQETDKNSYAFYNDFLMMNAVVLMADDFEKEQFSPTPSIQTNHFMVKTSFYDTASRNFPYQEIVFTDSDVPLIKLRHPWGGYEITMGRHPQNTNEIVIPYTLVEKLIGRSINIGNYQETLNAWTRDVQNKVISLEIIHEGQEAKEYRQEFKIVGMTAVKNFQINSYNYNEMFEFLNRDNEKLLAELPKDPVLAYNLFQNAYQNGYLLDVWAYQNDIDAYTIDPFVDLIAKAGLFVFAVFTIGILWTIITIEIVDSKKEIGIFRSFGLSGFRVSFIFIFQTFFISLIAYLLGLFGARRAIQIFNSQIMDELKVVHLSMYMMTNRSPLYLLVFLLIISSIAMIVPLYRIMSQKIIDVISERDSL